MVGGHLTFVERHNSQAEMAFTGVKQFNCESINESALTRLTNHSVLKVPRDGAVTGEIGALR